jgi:hypothetical protein
MLVLYINKKNHIFKLDLLSSLADAAYVVFIAVIIAIGILLLKWRTKLIS